MITSLLWPHMVNDHQTLTAKYSERMRVRVRVGHALFLCLRVCAVAHPGGTLSRWRCCTFNGALNLTLLRLRLRSLFFRSRTFAHIVSFRDPGFLFTPFPLALMRTGLLPKQDCCQKRTARIELPGQGCQDRTVRKKQPGQDSKEGTSRTVRTGQPEQNSLNGTFSMGQPEQERERDSQGSQKRTAKTEWQECDRQNKTSRAGLSRTGLPGQEHQKRAVMTRLPEKGSRIGLPR
jgi:hypothetical protein